MNAQQWEQPEPTPFQIALGRAIDERRVTLTWLADRLRRRGSPLSVATLSMWRSGTRRPERGTSMDAISEIEDLLGLDTGYLAELVGHSRRPGPDRRVPFAKIVGRPTDDAAIAATLGDLDDGQLIRLSVQTTVDLDATGTDYRSTVRSCWKARVDGVHRAVEWLWLAGRPEQAPTPVAGDGCVLGRTFYYRDQGLAAVEIFTARPLLKGERIGTELVWSGSLDESDGGRWDIVNERHTQQSLLWLRFHPDRVPSTLRGYARSAKIDDVADLWPVGSSVHHQTHNFGPGRFGIEWTW